MSAILFHFAAASGVQAVRRKRRSICLSVQTTLLAALLLSGSAKPARAEKYLTPEQAQHLIFPQAEHFEICKLRSSPAEMRNREAALGTKMKDSEVTFWLALRGGQVEGVFVLDKVMGKHEWIDYAMGLTATGSVQQVEILEYRERYGGEVRNPRWRDQFKNRTAGGELRLTKEIYNISGATISCRSLTVGIKRILTTYDQAIYPYLVAHGRLPGHRPQR